MPTTVQLTDEETDFLKEIIKIGATNAAAALSQILKFPMNVNVPVVHALPPRRVPAVLGNPVTSVACVKMDMVGDVKGEIFFIVMERDKAPLVHMAEEAFMGSSREGPLDVSVLLEIGNIVAGTYLTAIHDFCKLNIYHSVPAYASDMLQAILDELLANLSCLTKDIIVIENEFVIADESSVKRDKTQFMAFLLIIPFVESIKVLADSIKNADLGMKKG